MEEKKPIKVTLASLFLLIAILAIAIMGYVIYNLSTKNKASEDKVNDLNSKVSRLDSTVKDNQEKIDSISSTLNSINNETNNTNTVANSDTLEKSQNSKYSEITKRLENGDLLQLSDSINNNDGTYTLKGQIITVDKSKEQIAEFPFYKETGEYKQITIPSNTKCIYDEDNENSDTVENVFSKKLYYVAGMGACFNFNFENGKCVSVYEVATGH